MRAPEAGSFGHAKGGLGMSIATRQKWQRAGNRGRLSLLIAAAIAWLLGGSTALAQGDLSGKYIVRMHQDQPDRIPGPEIGEFLGLPLNDSARQFALSWDPARLTLPEQQCRSHSSPYMYRGPMSLRIWEERDPITQDLLKTMMYISNYEQMRTIWMDGRAHPSKNARHTWMGFSTGKWEGKVLTVRTTHIKQSWHRRNGVVQSDQATLTERFTRQGDYLTHISIVEDPVYLTEPLIRSESFLLAPEREGQQVWTYPCEVIVEVYRPQGSVPHFQPGENPFIEELVQRWGLSAETFSGGAAQMYPEYILKHDVRARRPAP